jgi:hypothetical protein
MISSAAIAHVPLKHGLRHMLAIVLAREIFEFVLDVIGIIFFLISLDSSAPWINNPPDSPTRKTKLRFGDFAKSATESV